MPLPTPPNPYRFRQHLPSGIEASSPEELLTGLRHRFGESREERAEGGLVAAVFEGDEVVYRVVRDGATGAFVGLQSAPFRVIQLFIRPCSGRAGTLTGIGTATGNPLFMALLVTQATASALVAFWRLFAALPNLCAAPCVMIPLGPWPSAIRVTVVGRFLGIPTRVTVTVDETAVLWCV